MALNIKDPETERLAAEVAAMTGESKTGAVRRALAERKQRLAVAQAGVAPGDRMVQVLERTVWPELPKGIRRVVLTKDEREAILGLGPDGA